MSGDPTYTIPLQQLQRLVMQPIRIGGLTIMLLDALSAEHEANWSHPSHRHPWYEFNYVSAGGLYTTSAGTDFRIEAGQAYLIPPGIVHSHRHLPGESDDGFCLRWQIMQEEGYSAVGTAEETAFIKSFASARPYALNREAVAPLLALRPETSLLALQTAFAGWLTGLYEDWRVDSPHMPQAQAQDHGALVVRQTMLFLQAYYASELRVQDIATALHVSYRNLARLFRKETGLTVVEKLNDIRVQQAKKLLLETDLPMKQIALAVGLKNEYYFSNLFKQIAMVAPSEFRSLRGAERLSKRRLEVERSR